MCYYRSQRDARDSHSELRHKIYIQEYVQYCRYYEVQERRHRISQPPQHAAEDVIERAARDPQKDRHQVSVTPVDYLRRSVQQLQKRHGHQRRNGHHYQRGDKGHGNAGPDGKGKRLSLPGAKVLGYHDPRSDGYSHKQNQQKIEYRPCASYRGKGIVSNIFTHNNAVNSVIQLLKHIAYEHRYHEFDDLAYRIALCHIYWFKYLFPHYPNP